jgi:alpha-tubulin suppressor-like RCC1 family protein
MRLGAWGICALFSSVACNAVLGLDNFRPCDGGECGDVTSADTSTDSNADGGAQCVSSSDCNTGDKNVVCSTGTCRSISSIARGMSLHECVVLSDGTARCWGRNAEGQLGNGSTSLTSVATPVQVMLDPSHQVPLTDIAEITLGFDFTCARLNAGPIYCWGKGAAGSQSAIMKQVSLGTGSTIQVSAAGDAACALLGDGTLYCWGNDTYGKFGCSDADASTCPPPPSTLDSPQKVPTINKGLTVAAGTYAVCLAYHQSGFIDCFGNEAWGNLGNGIGNLPDTCCTRGTASLKQPTQQIEPSDYYTCAKDNAQNWFCWGQNTSCAFSGTACNGNFTTPTPMNMAANVLDFSPGWHHACAITSTGVKCWGQNDHFQASPSACASNICTSAQDESLGGGENASAIAAHRHWNCAVGSTSGAVYCWGQNGDPSNDPTPWLLGAKTPAGDVAKPTIVRWDP